MAEETSSVRITNLSSRSRAKDPLMSDDISAYDGWLTDPVTGLGYPPIPYPEDGESYYWSVDKGEWVKLGES